MAIEVNVTSTLRTLVGSKSVQGDGATVGALLVDLEAKFPGFKEQISGDDGELHRFVNVYVNDEDIRYLNALDTGSDRVTMRNQAQDDVEALVRSLLELEKYDPDVRERKWTGFVATAVEVQEALHKAQIKRDASDRKLLGDFIKIDKLMEF